MEYLVFLGLLALGFFAGRYFEQQHYQEIYAREHQTQSVPVFNLSASHMLPHAQESELFVGSVVISSDYFKTFAGWLMSLFGGRLSVYETLVDRARREAILRMKEDAIAWGAKQVLNVRLETSCMNTESQNGIVSIEVIAYGTGIR